MTAIDGWNRNNHYHDLLLTSVPQRCTRALDVGCGLGTFARRLSQVADHVDAIDRDADVIQRAREASIKSSNIRFTQADFLSWDGGAPYDFISMIAVLHHLPFAETLAKAVALLRPGGVLAVIGLPRPRSLLHLAAAASVSVPLSAYYQLTRGSSAVGAPISEPTMTLSEIREQAPRVLPAATIGRLWLLRYSLVWIKPS
jgi:trans-aconitate methyltransferase